MNVDRQQGGSHYAAQEVSKIRNNSEGFFYVRRSVSNLSSGIDCGCLEKEREDVDSDLVSFSLLEHACHIILDLFDEAGAGQQSLLGFRSLDCFTVNCIIKTSQSYQWIANMFLTFNHNEVNLRLNLVTTWPVNLFTDFSWL